MKRIYVLMLLSGLACSVLHAQGSKADKIIFRDGQVMDAYITQVSKEQIQYRLSSSKDDALQSIDITDAYMIKFTKRGNVYITPEGKRITGENQKIDRDADVIYLVSGAEIQAYNLQISEDKITYMTAKKAHKGRLPQQQVLAPFQVFMICYHDGTRDIITDLTMPDPLRDGYTSVENVPAEEPAPPAEPEKQVVFHSVKRGEPLSAIGERYNVSIEDIKEWNDLPGNLKGNAKLQVGTQLMIYVDNVAE